MDQLEQAIQVLGVVSAVLRRGAGLPPVGQVAQGLQAVAEPVDVVADWKDTELAPAGLRAEAEQDAVDVDQGLVPQLLGGHLARAVRQGPPARQARGSRASARAAPRPSRWRSR